MAAVGLGAFIVIGCGGGGGGISSALVGKTYYIDESNENYSEVTYNTNSLEEIVYDTRGQSVERYTINITYTGTYSFEFSDDGDKILCSMVNSEPKHLTCRAEGGSNTVEIEQLTMTELIAKKNFVLIMKDSPSGICEMEDFRDDIADTFINLVTSEEDNSITCSKYGKTDGDECEIFYYEGDDADNVACVVGFNDVEAESKRQKGITHTRVETLITNALKHSKE